MLIDLTKDEWWRGIKEAQGSPKGWTQESFRSAFESLGGSWTAVRDAVEGKVDNPEGFASWLHYMALGKWSSEKSNDIEAYDDEQMYKALLKILNDKNISIPHPQTRLGTGNEATWKPATDIASSRIVGSGAGAIMLGKTFMVKDKDIPFEFACEIAKVEEKEGKFYLVGVASDNRIDKDNEIISENAIKEMAEEIKKGNVVLLPSHKADWDDEMGKVVDAKITPQNELQVICELDAENDKAQKLIKAVKSGKKLGLSIGGTVKKAYQKFIDGINKVVKVIDGIVLKHIAVTGRPANPRTWVDVIAKSIDEEVAKMVTKSDGAMSPQEAMDALKEAVAKEDEAKIAEARAKLKEALKKEAIAAGKKEDEAEAEAESMCKEAEASARKEAEARRKEAETHKEDGSLTVKMTKEQYEKVREILEKEAMKDNPVYKELTSELSKVTKELEDIKKALSTRKSIFKSADMDKSDNDADSEKAVKSFLEKTSKVDSNFSRKEQEHSVDEAFRETLKTYFGIK